MRAQLRRAISEIRPRDREVLSRLASVETQLATAQEQNAQLHRDVEQIREPIDVIRSTTSTVLEFVLGINHQTQGSGRASALTNDFLLSINHQTMVAEQAATLIKGFLPTINHHATVNDARVTGIASTVEKLLKAVEALQTQLNGIETQMAAEREAVFGSNDGTRRLLLSVGEALLGQPAVPHLSAAANGLAEAREVLDTASSQYRDVIPKDATSFASPLQ